MKTGEIFVKSDAPYSRETLQILNYCLYMSLVLNYKQNGHSKLVSSQGYIVIITFMALIFNFFMSLWYNATSDYTAPS